jgi:hypothetical protein
LDKNCLALQAGEEGLKASENCPKFQFVDVETAKATWPKSRSCEVQSMSSPTLHGGVGEHGHIRRWDVKWDSGQKVLRLVPPQKILYWEGPVELKTDVVVS